MTIFKGPCIYDFVETRNPNEMFLQPNFQKSTLQNEEAVVRFQNEHVNKLY